MFASSLNLDETPINTNIVHYSLSDTNKFVVNIRSRELLINLNVRKINETSEISDIFLVNF